MDACVKRTKRKRTNPERCETITSPPIGNTGVGNMKDLMDVKVKHETGLPSTNLYTDTTISDTSLNTDNIAQSSKLCNSSVSTDVSYDIKQYRHIVLVKGCDVTLKIEINGLQVHSNHQSAKYCTVSKSDALCILKVLGYTECSILNFSDNIPLRPPNFESDIHPSSSGIQTYVSEPSNNLNVSYLSTDPGDPSSWSTIRTMYSETEHKEDQGVFPENKFDEHDSCSIPWNYPSSQINDFENTCDTPWQDASNNSNINDAQTEQHNNSYVNNGDYQIQIQLNSPIIDVSQKQSGERASMMETSTENQLFGSTNSSHTNTSSENDVENDTSSVMLSPPATVAVPSLQGDTKAYTCSYCRYTSADSESMSKHIMEHLGDKNNGSYMCTYCDFQFTKSSELKIHVLNHKSLEPYGTKSVLYQCTHCESKFQTQISLHEHLYSVHNDAYFKCTYCEYKTYTSSLLNAHILTHSTEKLYKCEHCDFVTTQHPRLLAHHVRIHGNIPFKCTLCSFTCKTLNRFKCHIQTHTSGKAYGCAFCDYSCDESAALMTHTMNLHGKMLPYKCVHCGYSGRRPEDLTRHHKRCHVDIDSMVIFGMNVPVPDTG